MKWLHECAAFLYKDICVCVYVILIESVIGALTDWVHPLLPLSHPFPSKFGEELTHCNVETVRKQPSKCSASGGERQGKTSI